MAFTASFEQKSAVCPRLFISKRVENRICYQDMCWGNCDKHSSLFGKVFLVDNNRCRIKFGTNPDTDKWGRIFEGKDMLFGYDLRDSVFYWGELDYSRHSGTER